MQVVTAEEKKTFRKLFKGGAGQLRLQALLAELKLSHTTSPKEDTMKAVLTYLDEQSQTKGLKRDRDENAPESAPADNEGDSLDSLHLCDSLLTDGSDKRTSSRRRGAPVKFEDEQVNENKKRTRTARSGKRQGRPPKINKGEQPLSKGQKQGAMEEGPGIDNFDLPSGWHMQFKTRLTGATAGSRDMIVTAPNGTKFRSICKIENFLAKSRADSATQKEIMEAIKLEKPRLRQPSLDTSKVPSRTQDLVESGQWEVLASVV